MLKWNRCDQPPPDAKPSVPIQTDDLPVDLTGLWKDEFTGCAALFFYNDENALSTFFSNRIQKKLNDWGKQLMPRQIIQLQ